MKQLKTIFCFLLLCISTGNARAQQVSEQSIIIEFNNTGLAAKNSKPKFIAKYLKTYFQNSKIKFKVQNIIQENEDLRSQELKKELGLDKTYKLSVSPNTTKSQLKHLIKALNADPSVEYAELDSKAETNSIPNDPLYNSTGSTWNFPFDEMWAAKRIHAEQAWDSSLGEGIVIAIIDTGVDYNHPDLWDNIWVDPKLASDTNQDGKINLDDIDTNHNHKIENNEMSRNYIGYNFDLSNSIPLDYNRHGTSIAGVAAARGNNSEGITGIAPQAKIMVLKAIGDDGSGSYSNLAKAIIFAADKGAHITNSSWEGAPSRLITKAFKYAYKRGVVNISSAGNKNVNAESITPAALDNTISVGAIEPLQDQRANFSNYGSVVAICAPGAYITTTLSASSPKGNASRFVGDAPYQYWYVSGTSIASPHVAGVVALMLSKNPKLTNKDIKKLLVESSEHLDTDQNIGGLVDAAAAVTAAKNFKAN